MVKEKMFIVAGNVDDSIKSVTPVYDITIFSTFLALETYLETTPCVISTIIISELELPFTSQNMARLLDSITAPFLKMTGKCIYLISDDTPKDSVQTFLEENEITTIISYQGNLSSQFISEIVSGAGREADETETEIITYRMRASEYVAAQNIKKYETDEDHYATDEESLSEVPPVDEPEVEIPSVDIITNVYYVVGENSIERSLFTFISSQYLALTGKTFILESDTEYHRLTDMVKKSNVQYEYIDVEDFYTNSSAVVSRIRASVSRLIIMGCVNRVAYDYNFIFDVLQNNLIGYVDNFVKECDFAQTPYGSYYVIVCGDTVPDVLKCVNSLKYDIDETKVTMIGVRTRELGEINITSAEMRDIVQVLLEKNSLNAEVVSMQGINLRGEDIVYDVLSIINRGNERQG